MNVKKRSILKTAAGFTLVELMVVVGIIGILAAVAIPNFRRYQAKSKTAEARIQLAALYSAQAAAYSDFDHYVSCLETIGFDPSPEFNNRYYAIGFNAAATNANAGAVNNGLAGCTAGSWVTSGTSAAAAFGYGAGKRVGNASVTTLAAWRAAVGASASATAIIGGNGANFLAGAGGIISADNTTGDGWTVNDSKSFSHAQPGY